MLLVEAGVERRRGGDGLSIAELDRLEGGDAESDDRSVAGNDIDWEVVDDSCKISYGYMGDTLGGTAYKVIPFARRCNLDLAIPPLKLGGPALTDT